MSAPLVATPSFNRGEPLTEPLAHYWYEWPCSEDAWFVTALHLPFFVLTGADSHGEICRPFNHVSGDNVATPRVTRDRAPHSRSHTSRVTSPPKIMPARPERIFRDSRGSTPPRSHSRPAFARPTSRVAPLVKDHRPFTKKTGLPRRSFQSRFKPHAHARRVSA